MTENIKIELPYSSPFKKTLEALKQILTSSINFNITDKVFSIEDNSKDIIVNVQFPRLKIKMSNVTKDVSFSIDMCQTPEFIKPITAKEKLELVYDSKRNLLSYMCGSKTSSIATSENKYNGTDRAKIDRACIADMKKKLIEPTCIVDAKTFKDTLKDFKSCTGNVDIYAQKNGIKFVSNSQMSTYTSSFGVFDNSKLHDEDVTYLVASCTGKQLHHIHKIATSAKFVRVYTIRIRSDDDEEVYPLLFEAGLDEFGVIQVYIDTPKE